MQNFQIYSFQGQNVQNFLILSITGGGGGGKCIPGLYWELPLPWTLCCVSVYTKPEKQSSAIVSCQKCDSVHERKCTFQKRCERLISDYDIY